MRSRKDVVWVVVRPSVVGVAVDKVDGDVVESGAIGVVDGLECLLAVVDAANGEQVAIAERLDADADTIEDM